MLAFLSLAAQAESSVSIGIALTLAGMLIGGALVFGAQRQNVTQLNDSVKALTEKVDALTKLVADLSAKLQVMEAVDKAVADATGKHSAIIPRRDPRRD